MIIKYNMLQRQSILALILLLFLPFCVVNWCKQTYFKTGQQIKAMAVSPGGRYLAVAHVDNWVRFYHADNYVKIGEYNVGAAVNALRFSNDGYYLAIGAVLTTVPILNAYQPFGLNTTVNPGIGNTVLGLDFSNDSLHFVACGGTGTGTGKFSLHTVSHTIAWAAVAPSPVAVSPASSIANDCRISPFDGKIAVDVNSRLTVYDSALATSVQFNTASTTFSKMVFDPLANDLVYIDLNGNKLFNQVITSGATPTALTGPTAALYASDFSSNGKYIATGGESKILYIYDSSRTSIERWDTTDKIKGVVFNKHPISQKMFVGDISGEVLVLSFNCSVQMCASDYYLDPTGCKFCGDAIPKCINCLNQTVCDECVDGYFVNPNTYQCTLCPMLGCLTCTASNNCTQCHSGFYMATVSSLNTCKRCSQAAVLQGCAICNSSTICIACNNDYFLDTSTDKCKRCSTIANCIKCNNGTVCTECVTGYYKNGNVCAACDANCLSCEATATNCTQCPKGWYVNMPASYTCTRCQSGCLSCNNSNFCFECQNGMYEKTDGTCALCVFPCTQCQDSTVCYSCSQGYFLSGTTCSPCTNNCATCNSSSYCTSCLPGYYNFTGNVCKACVETYGFCSYCTSTACQSCQSGYFLNTSTLCQHCSEKMFKCEKCSSATTCLSCIEGFYHTGGTGNASCQSCGSGCQTCIDSGDCRKCYKQFYLDANLDCVPCTGNCLECTNGADCVVCDEGYFLDGTVCKLCKVNLTNCLQCTSGLACANCEIGYYLDSTDKKCKKCTGNCVTCDSAKCMSCQIGYYLTSTATPSCLACSQTCTQCTSPTLCTGCKTGFYLDTTLNTCKNCTYNRFCRTCNNLTCYSCVNGYYLDNSVSPPNYKCTRCLAMIEGCVYCNASNYCLSCDYGYYLDSGTNLCVTCNTINGCQKCTDSTTCLLCSPGYFLNTSSKCQQCKIGCSTCDPTGNCFTCSPGFYLNSVDCLPCKTNIEGCTLCSTSALCVQCMNGYYLQAASPQCNLCRKSLVGCLYCNNSATCTNCQPGFYLDSINHKCQTCEMNMVGCQICQSGSVCLDCQAGYYLTGGGGSGCTPCISSIAGCLSCNDINTCEICKTGFYLETDSKCHTCFTANSGCQVCTPKVGGGIICSHCSTGFYIEPVTSQCVPCGNMGCEICDQATPTVCITCDSMYYKNGTACVRCNSVIEGCSECLTDVQCVTCDVGYYLTTSNKCQLCQDTLSGCSKCQLTSGALPLQCSQCKSSYILDTATKTCSSCFSVIGGCTYCVNSSACISCSNGYFKDSVSNLCRSCTEQPGCMLCSNETACEYCGPSYYMDHVTEKCIKCSIAIEFCLTCLQPTRCLSCQSGYFVNDKFECQQVTVSATEKTEGVKLITEYIDKQTLSHTLMVQNDQYSNPGYDLTGSCNLYLTDYNQLTATKKISQVQLLVKEVKWLSPTKIMFVTDNPTNLNGNQMSLARRLQEDQSEFDGNQLKKGNELKKGNDLSKITHRLLTQSSMGNFKVSLQMTQQAVNSILPNIYQTGDLVLDYSLDEPQFYMSYMKQESSSSGIYTYFGYIICSILLLNFIYKTYKMPTNENSHHYTGEIMSHVFAMKSVALFHYPITFEIFYFCFGFMMTDIPWLNDKIGPLVGERSDYVPQQLVMYFYNLNIGSTFLVSLALSIVLLSLRFAISKNKELLRSKYTDFVYCVFMFGLTFAGSLSLQGAKFNPIKQTSLNAVFYLVGILVYLVVLIEMLYSVYNSKQNFYKVRIFVKATLLSIGHLNPIIVVSVSIITDILLIILQYILTENTVAWGKIWLVNNMFLDVSLALMFVLPNSKISLYGAMIIIGIVTLMELLLNFKLMSFCQERVKSQQKQDEQPDKDRKRYKSKTVQGMNESLQTFIDEKQYGGFGLWNEDYAGDVGSLHDIAVQDERLDQVKKEFLEGGETKYTVFGGFGVEDKRRGDDVQVEKEKKESRLDSRLEPRGRRVSRKSPAKELQHQKGRFNNPFRIQNSSSSSPTEESVVSIEDKKKTQANFIKSNNNKNIGNRQRKRTGPLS